MFFRAKLLEWRTIESSGVNAEQFKNKLRVIVPKLLHLMNLVIQDC